MRLSAVLEKSYVDRFIALCVKMKMETPLHTVFRNCTMTVPLHCRHSLSAGGP
ncbi:hypothetical protein [Peribacillus muralis]|uniref:hypothetical protein n=1 Tax=Peribacillus muralis TaxID=264697 RepID=UPI00367302E4